jgi:hypothetical protein
MTYNENFTKEERIAALQAIGQIEAAIAGARGHSTRDVEARAVQTIEWLKRVVVEPTTK